MEVEFQSLRDMFQYNNYFGIDLYKGKGVDIVLNGSDLSQLKKKILPATSKFSLHPKHPNSSLTHAKF